MRCCSDAKLAANRANAARSTGPRTADGKARSAENATDHGGYAALVLPSESDPAFHDLRVAVVASLAPHTPLELRLCDRAAALLWRLDRLQTAETGLLLEVEDAIRDKAATYAADYHAQPQARRDPALAPPPGLDLDDLVPPGFATADLFKKPDNPLDRLTRAEHRLQGMLNSTLRHLETLRRGRDALLKSPASPYLADVIADAPPPDDDDDAAAAAAPADPPARAKPCQRAPSPTNLRNEPTAPTPARPPRAAQSLYHAATRAAGDLLPPPKSP